MLHRRLLVPIVVAPLALGAVLTGTASAAPATPATSYVLGSDEAPAITPDAAVGVSITGRPAHYSKKSIVTHRTAAGATCNFKAAGVKVSNTTAVRQTVTYQGSGIGTLAPHTTKPLCGSSSAPISATFSLKSNHNAKLVVRFN